MLGGDKVPMIGKASKQPKTTKYNCLVDNEFLWSKSSGIVVVKSLEYLERF